MAAVRWPITVMLCALAGCSSGPGPLPKPTAAQMAQGMSRRGQAAHMSVDEIGRTAFGTAFRSARVQGDTVEMEYAPNQDSAPERNFDRLLLLANRAAPTTFENEPKAQKIRLTAVDAANAARRLAVFSTTRAISDKTDWQHGAHERVREIYAFEYVDPAFQAFAGSQNKTR